MKQSPGAPQDPETAHVQKSHLNFPVVGIGASAGGISALQRLFGGLPADSGMAFVVVMHLSPDHASTLDAILQRTTTMPVTVVKDAQPIRADHVYVISPSQRLSMNDGSLRVTALVPSEARHTAIDLFFRSLAQAHQERSVCIVLSGTGADGTQGLKRVKELGGVSLAQSLEEAEYDGMPRSAIETGLVDHVLPAAEMPKKLIEMWHNAQRIELPSPPDDLKVEPTPEPSAHQAEEALLSIKALLRERTGHNFAHYKRATVLRRLERRMQVNSIPDLPAYRRFLDTHPLETPALLQDMLISVTNFFRDPVPFTALERTLRAAFARDAGDGPFRAWVAGCATGEEAYSVAILLHELLASTDRPIQVFASDIDQRAIAIGRVGMYPASIATDVPPQRLKLYFTAESTGYRITKKVRDSVIFSAHNVLSDPPFTRMDLICCRNLLIYLDRPGQVQLLRSFHFALNHDGLLFLGTSETADAADGLFTSDDKINRLYRPSAAISKLRSLPPVNNLPPRAVAATAAQANPPLPPKPPLEVLHERMLAAYGPPTLLVDADDTLLHVSERAAHLLRLGAGAPSNKLLELARPEIRVQLRTALSRAAHTGRSVEAPRIRFTINGKTHFLNISVQPAHDETARGLFLVIFEESEESLVVDQQDGTLNPGDPVRSVLEAELLRLQELLRTSAGESAASTEELRASNEELQTINEELRSTTEELETSREELQSVNEELTTVNSELQLKVEETGKVNDDLHNLISSAEISTVFLDRGMRIKRFTPQAATLFNLLESDSGRRLLDITHRLDYPQLEGDLEEVFASLRRIEREIAVEDGRWMLVRVLPYRTNDDRIDGAVLVFIDVTARRKAEAELLASEQRMSLVANSMQDYAIITSSAEGIVTSWSPGAVRVFGYSAAEIVGQSADLLFTPEDRVNGVPEEEMRQARELGRAEDDRWHLHKDGSRRFCTGIMTPLIDAGRLTGYAKIARDFTSGKLLASHRDAVLDEERAVRSRLQESSALKDEFLAVMSHELKNPLNVINLNAQLLSRLPQARNEPMVVKAARTIESAVTSQAQIIDDLLDLSRVNTGKVVLDPSRLVLNDIVERIASAVQRDVEAKRQSLALDLGRHVAVFADPVRVEQIVWNLVTNAIKFTPEEGSIRIAIAVDGDMARLEVRDSGIGLAPPHLGEVFEMFRQVDFGTRRRTSGLGIGLALVKQLTELHGGRVAAASTGLGAGSTFSIWLPLHRKRVAAPRAQPSLPDLSGLRILLVDDEPETLLTFGELLRLEGAQVDVMEGAAPALALARRERFDIVVSDIAMPGEDGYWLIDRLREVDETKEVIAIAVSGMTREADHERALASGFDAYLGKPVAVDRLKAEIGRLKHERP